MGVCGEELEAVYFKEPACLIQPEDARVCDQNLMASLPWEVACILKVASLLEVASLPCLVCFFGVDSYSGGILYSSGDLFSLDDL